MKKLNQKGFGLWELILLLLLIILLGLLGWWVWQQNQEGKNNNASQSSSQNAEESEPAEEAAKYLEIPELGVKLKLDNATEDAYYTMSSGYAYLSLTSLKDVDDCAADETSIAAVSKVKKTDTNEMTGKTYEQEANDGHGTIIGENVYIVSQAQAFCTEQAGPQAKAEAARSAFPKLTIEAL